MDKRVVLHHHGSQEFQIGTVGLLQLLLGRMMIQHHSQTLKYIRGQYEKLSSDKNVSIVPDTRG